MDSSKLNKRVLTESMREAATDESPLASGAEQELALSLRNVGARVRRSVSQGYQTPSGPYAKAQSTGTIIFRSMNDTLRDIRGDSSLSSTTCDSSRKRSRSLEYDEEKIHEISSRVRSCPHESITVLPTEPLSKTNHAFSRTHSLPNGPVLPIHQQAIVPDDSEIEEEDWSHPQALSADQNFEPMEL